MGVPPARDHGKEPRHGAETVPNNDHQIIEAPFEGHSKKPDETRRRIVELLGDVPRLEMFARQRAEGWDAWGNEAPPEERTIK